MKKLTSLTLTLCVALGVLLSSAAYGGNEAKYAELTLEMTGMVNVKMMEKDWKKRKSAWEAEAKKAKDVKAMSKLLMEFESLLNSKTIGVDWAKRRKGWAGEMKGVSAYSAYGDHLIELANAINVEAMGDAWAGRKDGWISDIKKLNKAVALSSEAVKVDAAAFKTTFDKIWAEAKPGFAALKVGDAINQGDMQMWKTNTLLPQAAGAGIVMIKEEDSDNNRYVANYDAGKYEQNAKKLVEDLVKIMDGMMPEGFARSTTYTGGYMNGTGHIYEFQAEKFVEVGRRPSILIGARKNGEQYVVEFMVTEPVFKR